MRRKTGALVPLELSILSAAAALAGSGRPEFYGYAVARELKEREEARRLTAHGTLYRALERLEQAGLLQSRIEDPEVAAAEQRPRRRLYHITAVGERCLAEAAASQPAARESLRTLGGQT
jgi:PadR family transcriptional regulator, regulatory protein PadR